MIAENILITSETNANEIPACLRRMMKMPVNEKLLLEKFVQEMYGVELLGPTPEE